MNETKDYEKGDKPKFGPSSLAALVTKINRSFPKELTTDWRRFVSNEFLLDSEEEQSMNKASEQVVKQIQEFFVQASHHVAKGGSMSSKIITRPVEKRTELIVHELHVHCESPEITPQSPLRIAHCNAHCREWGWG